MKLKSGEHKKNIMNIADVRELNRNSETPIKSEEEIEVFLR